MTFLTATLALSLALAQQSPPPPDRRVLVDRELRSEDIRLLSLTDGAIVYEDAHGRRRQAAIGGIVALLPANPDWDAPHAATTPAPGSPTGALQTTDGQRLPGERSASGGDDQMIVWAHPVFGRISVGIDRVASAVLQPAPASAPPLAPAPSPAPGEPARTLDSITLINGDTLEGFVVSLGDPVEIEVDGRPISVAAERVASVRLANEPDRLRGLVVWLDDGSVVVVARIEDQGDQGVSIALPGGQSGVYPTGAVRAVAFEAGRLIGLAAIPPDEQSPVGERRTGEPLRILTEPLYGSSSELGAPDIVLPGPMRVRWTLPRGAVRFATLAEAPFDATPWGDCEIVVRIDGVERVRRRLNAEHPRVQINLPILGADHEASVEVIVEPGAYGPINDRIILRRPLVLLDRAEN